MGERLTALHDELAIVNKPFELERGDRVRDTGAKHRTKDEYLRDKAQMEKAVKELTTMIANLTNKRNQLEAEIKSLKYKNERDENRYTEHILELQEKLAKVQDQIDAKQHILNERRSKLHSMRMRINEAQAKAEKIEHAVHKAINNLSPARMLAAEVFIDEILNSMDDAWNNTRTTVPEDEYMNDSFAAAALSDAARIFKCGVLLFCGLVDDATTFAQNCGGSGDSQSDLPWLEKDEEDAAFMRRCMFHAHKMMKSGGGYKLKKGGSGRGY